MRCSALQPHQQLGGAQPRGARLLARAKPAPKAAAGGKPPAVTYGQDWYKATREAAKPRRTVREEMEYRRAANRAANNGRERKDLYTDNWDGSEYKGSGFNILSLLAVLFVLTPVAGLAFAKLTYGTLWG
ncbi:MAG: hypothetical protein J3K34DRAFT_404497 [Monoraphidium minutum]|nr:MAG: hypothetical protein J3K34DRAFT_404497 [Monoraphidium minutum]